MSDHDARTAIDEWISQWLDDDHGHATPPSMPERTLDDQTCTRIADQCFIDAMLASLAEQAEHDKEARVRRVMSEIRGNDRVVVTRTVPQLQWQSLSAIAACLAVACTLFWIQFSRQSGASEILTRIHRASIENTDRVYDVRRLAAVRTSEPNRGRLYLRGLDGFVLAWGQDAFVFGRNKQEFWCITSAGDLVVGGDLSWLVTQSERHRDELELLRTLSVNSGRVPLMQLASVVELMQSSYDVSVASSPDSQADQLVELIGQRRVRGAGLPDSIHLWSDSESGSIQRAQLSWLTADAQIAANTLVFELANDQHVPANWYDYRSHVRNEPVSPR